MTMIAIGKARGIPNAGGNDQKSDYKELNKIEINRPVYFKF